jgi:hypothetical protein
MTAEPAPTKRLAPRPEKKDRAAGEKTGLSTYTVRPAVCVCV